MKSFVLLLIIILHVTEAQERFLFRPFPNFNIPISNPYTVNNAQSLPYGTNVNTFTGNYEYNRFTPVLGNSVYSPPSANVAFLPHVSNDFYPQQNYNNAYHQPTTSGFLPIFGYGPMAPTGFTYNNPGRYPSTAFNQPFPVPSSGSGFPSIGPIDKPYIPTSSLLNPADFSSPFRQVGVPVNNYANASPQPQINGFPINGAQQQSTNTIPSNAAIQEPSQSPTEGTPVSQGPQLRPIQGIFGPGKPGQFDSPREFSIPL